MPFVSEAHCDAISSERPQLLDEAIVELSCPLAPEQFDDLLPAVCEFRAVSPSGIGGVGERHLRGIAGVPAVFRQTDFQLGALAGEWGHRGTRFRHRAFYRLTARIISSGYLVPAATPFGIASSSRKRSLVVSSTSSAAAFSSR